MIRSDQILLLIEIPKKLSLPKITSSKQLELTKTTYVNFEKYFRLNYEKKLFKTAFTEKLGKVTKFFNISKAYKSEEKIPSVKRVSRCSQNNRQVIIG